ncbi:zinc finger protein [Penicillium canescens]|nr:zinc finger protein [Penicillium canescens]KAJ6080766.1 zinc finger protein [Penicillium canescens]KAJ6177443.1 zinc finger protein [Penicillium canescens]
MEVAKRTENEVWFRGYGVDQYVYYATKGPKKFLGGVFAVESEEEFEKALNVPGASPVQKLSEAPGGGQMVTIVDPDGFPFNKLKANYPNEKQRLRQFNRFLTSGAVSDEPTREVLRKEFEMPSDQILLVETFFTYPTTDSLEDEWTRRNKAVAAGIQYCSFQEGGPLRGRRKRSTPSNSDDAVPSPPARKIKTDTPPTTSWEKGRTSGGKHTECRANIHMLPMPQDILRL